jgi:HTH-type transcriptional regulator/antitoxin HipB
MILRTAREIGLLVRDQRKKMRWTQDQLATRLGVSRLWVVHLEKGKDTAQIGLVLRALNELNIPMNVDLTGADRRPGPGEVDLDNIIREAARPFGS